MRIALAVVALAAVSAPAREPAPLTGTPLPAGTGLRLLVADAQPFVLEVDDGTWRRLDVPRGGVVWVVAVGGRAGLVAGTQELYGVVSRAARVASLGRGSDAWPAADGRGAWVQTREGRSRCTIARVALDGRRLRAPRPFPCATASDPPGGSLGLVVGRTRIVDPASGRTVLRARWGIVAVAGRRPLLAKPGGDLVLVDGRGRVERTFRSPSRLGGIPQASVDPSGRFVALDYGDPAWRGGARQVMDLWLLDTRTGTLALRRAQGDERRLGARRPPRAARRDGDPDARRRLAAGAAAARDQAGATPPARRRQRLVRRPRLAQVPRRVVEDGREVPAHAADALRAVDAGPLGVEARQQVRPAWHRCHPS